MPYGARVAKSGGEFTLQGAVLPPQPHAERHRQLKAQTARIDSMPHFPVCYRYFDCFDSFSGWYRYIARMMLTHIWAQAIKLRPHCDILLPISARAGFLSGAGTGLSRSPAPRKRSATTQTTQAALRRGSCCTLCSRLRPQLRRWKAASEAPQRGRGHRRRFCYSQLELAAPQEVGGDARNNDILTGRVSPKLALETTKEEGS